MKPATNPKAGNERPATSPGIPHPAGANHPTASATKPTAACCRILIPMPPFRRCPPLRGLKQYSSAARCAFPGAAIGGPGPLSPSTSPTALCESSFSLSRRARYTPTAPSHPSFCWRIPPGSAHPREEMVRIRLASPAAGAFDRILRAQRLRDLRRMFSGSRRGFWKDRGRRSATSFSILTGTRRIPDISPIQLRGAARWARKCG